MNEHTRPDMKDWEEQVNALLDGDLDEAAADELKSAAASDQELARAIIEGYQLQQLMAALPEEKAPASLRRKLSRIPKEQKAASKPFFFQPRWAMALAAVPLVVALVITQSGPKQPTEAELAQARQDLALAFTYLGKASRATEKEIRAGINQGMAQPVTENAVRSMIEPFELNQETQEHDV